MTIPADLPKPEGMCYAVFHSSFRSENTPCISHVTNPEQTATMCGLRGWSTLEEPFDPEIGVDCQRCAKAVAKRQREIDRGNAQDP